MSDSAYCWFDWDDNTKTVNLINIIKEPRKPRRYYNLGESVLAKLPQFGLWRGVIVDINGKLLVTFNYLPPWSPCFIAARIVTCVMYNYLI